MKDVASHLGRPSTRRVLLGLALVFVAVTSATSGHARSKSKRRHVQETQVAPGEEAERENGPVEGTAFVFVEGRGILRLREDAATVVMQTRSAIRDMRLDGEGGLWASLRETGVVRVARGEAVTVNKESFEKLAVRSPTDVWAINDSHGSVVHFDGSRWKTARTRNSLPGAFEDNRLLDTVTDGRTLWVSGWNGLWRVRGGRWTHLEPPTMQAAERDVDDPAPPPFPLSLTVSRQGLLACYPAGCFLAAETGWQASHWPAEKARLLTAGATNLLAGIGVDGRTVVIGRSDGSTEATTSETLPATGINDIAIDGAERIWVAVGSTLVLLNVRGRTLARWTPTASGSDTGIIQRVLVAGTGPARLPAE